MDANKAESNFVLRRSQERGHAQHGWLNSYHTFSFANYYDPSHMGFRTLRVINEDRIAGGSGFGAHSHEEMEIISYVVSGGLEHQDSMGNTVVILPDEVQIMSAGTGVTHAEMNHLEDTESHFFQIWIFPDTKGIPPSYGQKSFKDSFSKQNLTLVVSKDKRDGSLGIHQDADVYIGRLASGEKVDFEIRSGRYLWIQMIAGRVEVNKIGIDAGDGLAVSLEKVISIFAKGDAEFILFDLN